MASINNLVSYELNGVKESFANWISNLSPTETPFVSMTGKEAVKNKFFQWQEDQLGAFGANAVAEGSDAGNAALKTTTVRQNVTQILRKSVSVSDTANALSSYGRGKEMQYQLEKAGKEIKRDLEWAFLNQKASIDGTGAVTSTTGISPATLESSYVDQAFDANGNPTWNQQTPYSSTNVANGVRFTAGFEGLVAPLNQASPEDVAAIVHISGDLTEENLFKVDEGLYLAGACPDIIMYHPKHARFFSGLMETPNSHNRIRMFDGASDIKVNTYVSTLVTPLGCTYKLIPNRFMPEDRIYFFRAADWTQMVLRAPTTQLLAKTGSHDKYMIEMEVGLRHKNQFASGILEVIPSGAKVTAAGPVQYSANGTSGWAATIPAANRKVNTDVDYYFRINPTGTTPADDGTYQYNFKLVPDADGADDNTPNTSTPNTDGIGGLGLTWTGNLAHVTGKVPADQVGMTMTLEGTIKDVAGTVVSGTAFTAKWTA